MLYTIDSLKRDIRIVLDQNATSEQMLTADDIDTLTLEEIIGSKIEDAARIVADAAPLYLLNDIMADFSGQRVEWDARTGYGPGRLPLPGDFLRLGSFRMSDWRRTIRTVFTDGDPEYDMQSSRYPGIRGCPQKPVVAIVNRSDKLHLEFFSCAGGKGVTVSEARYVKVPAVTAEDKIDLARKVKSATVYAAASLVAQSIGQADLSAALSATSNNLMQ